jgi:hypothetical protein
MRSSDTLDAIGAVERRYPVADWRVAGLRVWPLIRVRLYTLHTLARLQQTGPVRAGWRRLLDLASRAAGSIGRVTYAAISDWRGNRWPRPGVAAVILSDGVSMSPAGGSWFDRVCDPLILWLESHGLRAFVLTPQFEARVPRRTGSMFVQPLLDVVKLFGTVRGRASRASQATAELPGYAEACAELAAAGLAEAVPTTEWLHVQVSRIRALAAFYGWIFERTQPRRAFVNTYYSAEGMAFVLAARRRGIPVADLQHGIQGPHHVAYGRWSNVPPQGYELLPDEFWVWGEAEARAIEAWQPGTTHRVVRTGNAWLQIWRQGTMSFVADAVAAAGRTRASSQRPHHVLFSVTWGVPAQHDADVLEALARLPDSYFIWVRLHPLQARARSGIRAMLQRSLPGRYELDAATDLPLPAVLRAVDLNLTHCSTTVIEAAAWGIRTVITSTYGAELFEEQIDAGFAVVELEPPRLEQSIRSLLETRSDTATMAGLQMEDGLDAHMRRIFAAEGDQHDARDR